MKKELIIRNLEEIVKNSVPANGCEFEIVANDWAKGNNDRTYLSIVEKTTDYSVTKHYVKRDYGYYDNNKNEYVPGKNDATKKYTFSGASF